jgi:undecaprenyl-diphosphatase
MPFYFIIFLAAVQGITEFLPISSSAHLILGRDVLVAMGFPPFEGTEADFLAFDVALHVGTLASVMVYFRKDVVEMIHGLVDGVTGRFGDRFKLLSLVVVGTIPVVIVGFLARGYITDMLRAVEIIAWTTVIFGLLLWVADRMPETKHRAHGLTYRDAVLIGLMQCIALIPGVSRSGICMTAGRLLRLDRPLSARFALLLAMPTITAAGTLMSFELYQGGDLRLTADAVMGGILAFFFAWAAIALMMRWLRHASYMPFIVYRIALGILLLVLIYGFGWSPAALV